MVTLDNLRERGWCVAAHNDYSVSGKLFTFWLLAHKNGRWVKGEATSDEEALAQCELQIRRNHLEKPPTGPFASKLEENASGNGWLTLGFNTYDAAATWWRVTERLWNQFR